MRKIDGERGKGSCQPCRLNERKSILRDGVYSADRDVVLRVESAKRKLFRARRSEISLLVWPTIAYHSRAMYQCIVLAYRECPCTLYPIFYGQVHPTANRSM